MHDKINLKLFTCFNPLTKNKLVKISQKFLNKFDKIKIIKELKTINNIAFSKIDEEIKKLKFLKKQIDLENQICTRLIKYIG